ncbi:hypothetical protein [Arachnia propionica]|uniref:Uncharacterized protein n=1 Tax=Arachnia propionica TaxID=1750 RepID=A0A3P1WUF9_9ACTN|nr:hypothetical protein [Arachnia propionica]RRD49528.1 hypothetical protein EII35_07980 [Arachnia propionica]
MFEVIEDESAAAILDQLWEQGRENLLEKIDEAVGWIADGDVRARRHRLDAPILTHGFVWAIRVTDQGQSWLILWSEVTTETAKIHAVSQTNLL